MTWRRWVLTQWFRKVFGAPVADDPVLLAGHHEPRRAQRAQPVRRLILKRPEAQREVSDAQLFANVEGTEESRAQRLRILIGSAILDSKLARPAACPARGRRSGHGRPDQARSGFVELLSSRTPDR